MAALTRRATAEFRKAPPSRVTAGRSWYAEANAIARGQAERHGVTIEVAAGVIAALSPRMGWATNVGVAERMLRLDGALEGGALSRSIQQARAIYDGGRPLDVLSGPKVRAFYTAILTSGEEGSAVIDRHAWDMLTGRRGSPPPTQRQYAEAAAIMARAAVILNERLHDTQAVTWLQWRARFWSRTAFSLTPQSALEGVGG